MGRLGCFESMVEAGVPIGPTAMGSLEYVISKYPGKRRRRRE